MKINKKIIANAGVFMTVLLLISLVSAFSVSAPYMEKNAEGVRELRLLPGDVKSLEFVLQNGGGAENIGAKASIREGSEILERTDAIEIYTVVPGEQTKVNFKVTIPDTAQLGDTFNVVIGFSTASESEEGTFAFGSAIEQKFNVLLAEEPKEVVQEEEVASSKNNWIYVLIIAIILAGLAIFIVKKRKNQ